MKQVKRDVSVVIGKNSEYVMAKADIYRDLNRVLIQIVSNEPDGQLLADFLEQAEPIGLSFRVIPVQNIIEKKRETI
jgi:hypothetical protein